MQVNSIVYVSTFPPTQCGIATYTSDLLSHFHKQFPELNAIKVKILPDDEIFEFQHAKDKIPYQRCKSLPDMIEEINKISNCIVHLQHEFKLFGGRYGENIIPFIKAIKHPLITTLHTVREETNKIRRDILETIANNSRIIYLFSDYTKMLLSKEYGIDSEKINVIPHGVPSVTFHFPEDSSLRDEFYSNFIFISAGHFRDSKGIETALKALYELKKDIPDFKYIIIGADHPRNYTAKPYREFIRDLIKKLNLVENIIMVEEYLPIEKLIKYIQVTDIALVPYTNKDQSSSGILSLFIACGRPVISTSFQFATTVINGENGILVEPNDVTGFRNAIKKISNDKVLRQKMMQANFIKSQTWNWDEVAHRHNLDLKKIYLKSVSQ